MILFDIGAQLVILGVQFAKKMGMIDHKLRKSMWQIRIASGNIKEVLRENSDLIALNFNEGTDQELCLHVRCFVHQCHQLQCAHWARGHVSTRFQN